MTKARRRIRTSGGEIAYLDLGEGPPVVLLHGFPTSADLWQREALLLSSRMRVIAPDLLGYGESDKPEGADLSLPAQAALVNELLDALGVGTVAAVGHELGGGIAQLLGIQGRARALVLLDTVCFDAWPAPALGVVQESGPEEETEAYVESAVRLAFDVGVARDGRMEAADVERFVQPWRSDPPAFFRAARALDGRGLSGQDAELARLEIPIFVLWGEDDPFLPASLAERLGDLVLGSTVALLPGCSHFVNLDAPETVAPLVFEFLRSRYFGEAHRHAPAGTGSVPVFLERPTDPAVLEPDLDGSSSGGRGE